MAKSNIEMAMSNIEMAMSKTYVKKIIFGFSLGKSKFNLIFCCGARSGQIIIHVLYFMGH